MKCQSCGADIKRGVAFCSFCGAKVEDAESKPTFSLDKNQLKSMAGNAVKMSGEALKSAGVAISKKAVEAKDAAMDLKDDIQAKLTELDRMLEGSITEYNDAYTLMNDKGMQLYVERCRAVDTINNVEQLINSIANHPKSFDSDFEEINTNRKEFTNCICR